MRNQAVTKEAMERYLNVAQGIDQTIKINNQSSCILKLQHFARIDREARAKGEKWAAEEKAKYESQLAAVDEFRAYEKVLYAGVVKQWEEERQVLIKYLTAPLSVSHAAEIDALIKTRDGQLKLQGELIDAYRAHLTSGTLQMEKDAKKYRADLSDEATKHRAEITKLYDRIAALVDCDGNLRIQLRVADVHNTMHVAALAAKDAEIARLKEELAAFRLEANAAASAREMA